MRISLLLLITFITSCGLEVQEPDPTGNIGNIWQIQEEEKFSVEEVSLIESICAAISEQEAYLRTFVLNSTKVLKYELSQTNCGEEKSLKENFDGKIVEEAGELKLETAQAGSFTQVLTKESKVIKSICESDNSSDDLTRYIKNSSTAMKYYFFKGDSGDCEANTDEACMFVETGIKVGTTDKFQTRDIESYKVSLNKTQFKQGLLMNRSFYSSETCEEDGEIFVKSQSYIGRN